MKLVCNGLVMIDRDETDIDPFGVDAVLDGDTVVIRAPRQLDSPELRSTNPHVRAHWIRILIAAGALPGPRTFSLN